MSLSLTNLRRRMRDVSRNANATYTNAEIDLAIEKLIGRFLQMTTIVKTATTVAIDDDTNEADLSEISGFLPTRVERARVRDDKQVITLDADVTSFTLTYDDEETGSIDDEATAATVQTALEALSNLASGDVVVTGDAGGPYTVQFPTFDVEDIELLEATPTPSTAEIEVESELSNVTAALKIVPIDVVLDAIADDDIAGTPAEMGLKDSTTAKVYPKPIGPATLEITYSPLQTPWEIGTRGAYSASAVYLEGDVVSSGGILYRSLQSNHTNKTPASETAYWESLGAGTLATPAEIVTVIPDGLMVQIINHGGAPALQSVDVEHQAFTGAMWREYLAFEASCDGMGSIKGKSSSPPSLRV
jgi:hypothetical protein